MNTVDVTLLLLLFFFALRGFWKGFFHEMMSLLAMLVGCAAGLHWGPQVAAWLGMRVNVNSIFMNFLAFLVVYTPTFIAIRLVRSFIERFWPSMTVSPMNGLAGLFFGLSKGAVVLGCAVILMSVPISKPNVAYADSLVDKVTGPVERFQGRIEESAVAKALSGMTRAVFSVAVNRGEVLFAANSTEDSPPGPAVAEREQQP